MLDALLPQVSGRTGDIARFVADQRSARSLATPPTTVSADIADARGRPNDARGSDRADDAQRTGLSRPGTKDALSQVPRSSETPGQAKTGPATGSDSTALHLSRTGRLLARLIGSDGLPEQAAIAPSARPLIAPGGGPVHVGTLSHSLMDTVVASGLFYESHLADWVQGRYPLERLRHESAARHRLLAATPEPTDSALRESLPAVDSTAGALVRQQLALLAGAPLQWTGRAWPEAPMRWVIEPGTREGDATSSSSSASMALSLELPGLGRFEARLRVVDDRLSLAAWSSRADGRALMNADMSVLRRRLTRAGFVTPTLSVVSEADTDND